MLEVEPTGQCDHAAIRNHRNSNEAVSSVTLFYLFFLFTFNSRLEAHAVIYNGKIS